jgi:hypothetical protein
MDIGGDRGIDTPDASAVGHVSRPDRRRNLLK